MSAGETIVREEGKGVGEGESIALPVLPAGAEKRCSESYDNLNQHRIVASFLHHHLPHHRYEYEHMLFKLQYHKVNN